MWKQKKNKTNKIEHETKFSFLARSEKKSQRYRLVFKRLYLKTNKREQIPLPVNKTKIYVYCFLSNVISIQIAKICWLSFSFPTSFPNLKKTRFLFVFFFFRLCAWHITRTYFLALPKLVILLELKKNQMCDVGAYAIIAATVTKKNDKTMSISGNDFSKIIILLSPMYCLVVENPH